MSGLSFKALKGTLKSYPVSKRKSKSSTSTNKKRQKQLSEIKRLDEEKLLLTAEERLITVHKDPEMNDRYMWSLMLYLDMTTTVATLIFCVFITHELEKYSATFDLLDSYDGGSFFATIECQFISVIVTNGVGAFILSTSKMRIKRGRMRYMIYAFAGWCMASCVSLIGTVVQIITIIIGKNNLFKDGFFLSMMVYGRDSVKARKIHDMQLEYECCGSFGYEEWLAITWSDHSSKTTLNLPPSCCDLYNYTLDECRMEAPFGYPEKLTAWPRGCVYKLLSIFVYLLTIVLPAALILLLVELAMVFMLIMKFSSIKSYQNLLIEERIRLAMKRLAIHKRRGKIIDTKFDKSVIEKYKNKLR